MSKRPLPPDGGSSTSAWKKPKVDSGSVQVGGEQREISSIFDLSLMMYVNGYYIQGMLCQFAQTLSGDARGSKPIAEQMLISAKGFIKSEWQMGKVPLLKRGHPRPAFRYVVPIAANERKGLQDADHKPPYVSQHSHPPHSRKYVFQDAKYCQQQSSDDSQQSSRSSGEKCSLPGVEHFQQKQIPNRFKPSSESHNEKYGTTRTQKSTSNRHSKDGVKADGTDKIPLLPTPEHKSSESTIYVVQNATPAAGTKTLEPSYKSFKEMSLTTEANATAQTPSDIPNSSTEHEHRSRTDAHAGQHDAVNRAPSRFSDHAGSQRKPKDIMLKKSPHRSESGGSHGKTRCGDENTGSRRVWVQNKNNLELTPAGARLVESNSQNSCRSLTETTCQNSCQCLTEIASQNRDQQLTESKSQNSSYLTSSYPFQQFSGSTEKIGSQDKHSSAGCPSVQETGRQTMDRGTSSSHTSTYPSSASVGHTSSKVAGDHQQNCRGWYEAVIPVRVRKNQDSANGQHRNAHTDTDSAPGETNSEQLPLKTCGHSCSNCRKQSTGEHSSHNDQCETILGQPRMTSTQARFWQATSEEAQRSSGKLQQTTSGKSETNCGQLSTTCRQSQTRSHSADDTQATFDKSHTSHWQSRRNSEQSQETLKQSHWASTNRPLRATLSDTSMTCDHTQAKFEPSPPSLLTSSEAQLTVSQVTCEQWQETVRRIQESVQKLHQMQTHGHGKEDAPSAAPSSFSSSSSSPATLAAIPTKVTSRDPRKTAHKPKGFVPPVAQQHQQAEKVSTGTDPRHGIKETATRQPADLPVPAFSATAETLWSLTKKARGKGSSASSRTVVKVSSDFIRNLVLKVTGKHLVVDRKRASTQTEAPDAIRPALVVWGTDKNPKPRMKDGWTFPSSSHFVSIKSTQTAALQTFQVGTMTSHARRSDHSTMTERAADQQTMTIQPSTRDVSTVPDTSLTVDTHTMTEYQSNDTTLTPWRTAPSGQQDCKDCHKKDSNLVPLGIEIRQNPGPKRVTLQTLSIPAADEGEKTVRVILRVKARSKFGTI